MLGMAYSCDCKSHNNMLVTFVLICGCLDCALTLTNASMVLTNNPYFYVGKQSIDVNSQPNDTSLTALTYICTFTHLSDSIHSVYYSTTAASIDAYNTPHPQISDMRMVNFSVVTNNHSQTHLTLTVSGNVQTPLIQLLTLRFIAVFENSPLRDTYIKIRQLQFTTSVAAYYIFLPSVYEAGDEVAVRYMLSSLTMEYTYHNLISAGYELYSNLDSTSVKFYTVKNQNTSYVRLSKPSFIMNTYRFYYTVVVLLPQRLMNDYPLLLFQMQQLIIISGTDYIWASSNISLGDPDCLTMVGVGSWELSCAGQCTIRWETIVNNGSMYLDSQQPSGDNGVGSYSYQSFVMQYYGCPEGYPVVVNVSSRVCARQCQDGFYYNHTTKDCELCDSACLTCYGVDNCSSCNTSLRYLSMHQCLLYDAAGNSSNASVCLSLCLTCLGSSDQCDSCHSNSTLMASTCVLCSDLYAGCVECDSSQCLRCDAIYTLTNATHCNPVCTDVQCEICETNNPTICLKCINSELVISNQGQCESVCGDRSITLQEECDDGNTVAKDGCSSECRVEDFYECKWVVSGQGRNYTSYCSYTASINFTLLSTSKLPSSNAIVITLAIQQYQEAFWQQIQHYHSYLTLQPLLYFNLQADFFTTPTQSKEETSSQAGQMRVSFDYTSPVEQQNISLGFNFSGSSYVQLSRIPPHSITTYLSSSNNQYLYAYSDQTYTLYQLLTPLYTALSYLILVLLTIGLVAGSGRIPADAAFVLQSSYLGLMTLSKLSPLQYAITYLSPAAQVYDIIDYDYDDSSSNSLPMPMQAIQLRALFVDNCNVALFLLLLPLCIGAIVSIVAKCQQSEYKSLKLYSVSGYLLAPTVFSVLNFSGCFIGAVTIIQLQYGGDHESTEVSLVVTVLCLVVYAVYAVAWVWRSSDFGEYSSNFNQTSWGIFYRLTQFFTSFLVGSLTVLAYDHKYCNVYVGGLCMLLFILLWTANIYKKQLDSYRTAINLGSIMLVQGCYLYYHLDPSSHTQDLSNDVRSLLPATIGAILAANFIANTCYLTYQVVLKIKDKCTKRTKYHSQLQPYNQERQFRSGQSQCQRSNNINSFSPLVSISNQFKQGFIEESEVQEPDAAQNWNDLMESKFKAQLKRSLDVERRIVSEYEQLYNNYTFTNANYTLTHEFSKI